jgi:hypothetical protein
MSMMGKPQTWITNLLGNLEDGQYWHVPSDDLVMKVDKKSRTLKLLSGDSECRTAKYIANLLEDVGYSLLIGEAEYYCP